jgi:spore coat polysaccharide biosynthesis protein SpsF
LAAWNSSQVTKQDLNIVIITQARMTSTRLPGKIAIEVAGKTLLEHHLERIRRSRLQTMVVVATTTNETDDIIVEICDKTSTAVYRGSEHDVLSRYYFAASAFNADIVVRVTSDCPLIDPEIIDLTIRSFLSDGSQMDYVSNCRLRQTYPRGLDTEVFTFAALKEAHEEANQPFEREHVTPFIWQRPKRFNLANVDHVTDFSNHRWTVDTPEDLELIDNMVKVLYPTNRFFGMRDCIDLLDANPTWEAINKHVEQKKL